MTDHLASLYTPLEDAATELHARHVARVHESDHPLVRHLATRPYAVLSRYVATPNFEVQRFVSIAASIGVTPLILEFRRDRFLTRNSVKCALARIGFSDSPHCNGSSSVRYLSIAHLPTADGMPLHHVTTTWGQQLIAFHRELLSAHPVLHSVETYDSSDWFAAQGSAARRFYADFLSLFVSHGILFESFLTTPHEQAFTSEVVLPAFEAAYSRHGRRPLICRLDPNDAEGHSHWLQYPHALREFVADRLSSTSTSSRNEPNG